MTQSGLTRVSQQKVDKGGGKEESLKGEAFKDAAFENVEENTHAKSPMI